MHFGAVFNPPSLSLGKTEAKRRTMWCTAIRKPFFLFYKRELPVRRMGPMGPYSDDYSTLLISPLTLTFLTYDLIVLTLYLN